MYAKFWKALKLQSLSLNYRDFTGFNAVAEGYALNGYGYDAMRTIIVVHHHGLISD